MAAAKANESQGCLLQGLHHLSGQLTPRRLPRTANDAEQRFANLQQREIH